MAEWKKDRGNIPVINVAVFGVNEHGQNKLRERARLTSDASIPSKKLGSLRGGKSQEKFLGDAFVDKSELFHEQNYSKRFLKRSQYGIDCLCLKTKTIILVLILRILISGC